MPVIGFLGSATAKQWAPLMGAFLEGLSEAKNGRRRPKKKKTLGIYRK